MRTQIIEIMTKIRPDINYEKESHLLSAEVLDSFDIVMILSELSDKFLIEIPPDYVSEKYFDNVDGLEKLVQKCIDNKMHL